VDIDFALEGIDKLLRSQELTFGFVGVAPSLAILYVIGGWIKSSCSSSSLMIWRSGKYGKLNHHGREESFYLIRRIERLLLNATIPSSPPSPSEEPSSHYSSIRLQNRRSTTRTTTLPLPAQTQGLLIVSITHLRRYIQRSFPNHRSRIRQGFLEDLSDLENPTFGKEEKLSVVHRMWRSWGQDLGWGNALLQK